MARRPNYDGAKRQKEVQRQEKKDAKEEKKRLKKEEAAASGQVGGPEGEGGDSSIENT